MRKPQYIIFYLVFLLAALSHSANAESSLVITEIMYNPVGVDDGRTVDGGTYFSHEWVEIFNTSGETIDLTGWKFNDGENHILNVPPEKGGQGSMAIPPGGYAILAEDALTFLNDHPGFSGTVIDTLLNLTNTSKTISLIDPDGNTVDSVTYQNSWGGSENDYTIEKTDSGWRESPTVGGTPGTANISSGTSSPPPQNTEPPQEQNPPQSSSPSQTQPANQAPKAKAKADKTEVVIGENITFDASESADVDKDELTFIWNFGDEDRSQKETVTHSYNEPGTYNVVLLVSDGELEAYDFLTITVTKPNYSAQIFINEFIPNPIGSDTDNEWIELINESNEEVNLSGWQLDDEEGGSNPFMIPEGTKIGANTFLVLPRPQTKIALNNDGDKVRLIWPNGFVLQEVSYEEKVKEGWSAARFYESWQWTNSTTPKSNNILSQAEDGVPDTKTSKVSSPEPTSNISTLRSSVNTIEDGESADNKANGKSPALAKTIEEKISFESDAKQAEAQKASAISNIKYFPVGIAVFVSLAGAFAMFILKKKLKTPF